MQREILTYLQASGICTLAGCMAGQAEAVTYRDFKKILEIFKLKRG